MRKEKNNTDGFYLFGRINLITILTSLALAGLGLTWLLTHYF